MTVMSRVVKVGLSGMGMGLYKEVYSSDTLLSRRPQTQKAVRTVGAAMETGNGGRFSFTVLGLVPSRHNNNGDMNGKTRKTGPARPSGRPIFVYISQGQHGGWECDDIVSVWRMLDGRVYLVVAFC